MSTVNTRPDVFRFRNGGKSALPFTDAEYESRLQKLRMIMASRDITAVLFTSMHNIAYYSGFLYCSFNRSYGCVITNDQCITISANIDGGQPWRQSVGDNLVYTDWQRGNFWRAVKHLMGGTRRVGFEADHLSVAAYNQLADSFNNAQFIDIAADVMAQRMLKSDEEIALIKEGARIADIGGAAMRATIRESVREVDVAMAGRDAIETEIARTFPHSEIRDNWVWFQSGPNTDGAHNPVTTRSVARGDVLSLNVFPMISGYYTALERTLFLGTPDADSLRIWQANVSAHELGMSLIQPGAICSEICVQINDFLAEEDLLQHRSFGYGHSFGLLSHYYGREAGLELREDIDTSLEAGMVVSMEPMLTIPLDRPGAGGYREHDILVVDKGGAVNITGFPYGPEHHIVDP